MANTSSSETALSSSDDDAPGFAAIVHVVEHHMPPPHQQCMLTYVAPQQASTRRDGFKSWPPVLACVVLDVLASWVSPLRARCPGGCEL
jgi:hypothetical protein